MPNFSDFMYADLIISDLNVQTKEEVIKALIDKLYQEHPDFTGNVPKDRAYEEVQKREELQTTGLGKKMAFPHARIKGWNEFVIVLGYSKEGIDFNSLDNIPAHFICLMISSEENSYIILKTMSNILRFLSNVDNINSLFENKTPLEFLLVFEKKEGNTSKVVEAQDIMRPLKSMAKMDDSLENVVKLMHLRKIDVLPVVDADKKLKGQISCFNIFEYEIPEFFKQLRTVSFVRNIDPFEKYFKYKKDLKVKDILKEDCATVEYNTTLIEIIYLLTVKSHPRLFVIREGKLVGIIDRFSVLDRILFF